MKLNLPLHPTKRHPLTGEPLRAVWVRPDGRVMWPIIGAAEDDDNDKGKPDDDADKSGDKGKAGDTDDKGGDADKDRGFPANTPVAEMTLEQRAAYWQHQSRKHEERATAYRSAAGGKTADEIKADLEAAETLRREKMNADERALEDAKRQAREEANREYGPKSVRAAFDLLLGEMPEEERNAELELLDLSKFLTDSGTVDTAKVRRAAGKIAHTDKGKGNGTAFDFGAGNRGGGKPAGGVATGASRYAARKNSATSTTN